MIVARAFAGIVGGVERRFRPGDEITAAEAKEMGLANKPGLAKKRTKKEPDIGSEPPKA